jgi:hypothetical protein
MQYIFCTFSKRKKHIFPENPEVIPHSAFFFVFMGKKDLPYVENYGLSIGHHLRLRDGNEMYHFRVMSIARIYVYVYENEWSPEHHIITFSGLWTVVRNVMIDQ